MAVLIVSSVSWADLMSGKQAKKDIIGAILPNRKILSNRKQDQRMLEGALQSLDEKTGKKLGGDALFQEIYPFVGRMPLGANVVETAEAREILTEAGIL